MAAATGAGYWTGALGGLEFGVVDASGVTWTWRGLDGWDGAPTVGTVAQRASDHGGWLGPQYYGPRVMTLRASADAPSQAARDAARAALHAALPVDDTVLLRVDEPTPKQAYVRRSGSLSETYPNLAAVDFDIGLVAPDPRKYGTAENTVVLHAPATAGTGITPPLVPPLAPPGAPPAASANAANAGNFEAHVTATITGTIAGPSLANQRTGQVVSYPSLTLGPADVLLVDFDARQGYLNGAFRPAAVSSAWWELQPGDNTITLGGASDGSAVATARWRDAYL